MQSGNEWILPMAVDVDTLRECAEAICGVWTEAVVEDTAAGEFAHSVESLMPTEKSELCVYRDLDVTRRWQHGGEQRETYNSMIQLSLTRAGVRLIIDDWQDPRLAPIVARLTNRVRPSNRVGKDFHATSHSRALAGLRLSGRSGASAPVDRVADDLSRQVP